LADGTYDESVSAPGFSVATESVVVASGTAPAGAITLESSGQVFNPLPVFGGGIGGVVADGTPGVFYANTSVIPQLFRTSDWGGTWVPVTTALDDPAHGLATDLPVYQRSAVATSGTAGEVAVVENSTLYYSTDFGNTWKNGGATPSGKHDIKLAWGHAGSVNVILYVDDTGVELRADMSATTPTLTEITPAFLGANDVFAVANSTDGPYVADLDQSGNLKVFTLPATGAPVQVGSTTPGFPSNAQVVGFGGPQASGHPPATVIAASGGQAVEGQVQSNNSWQLSSTTAIPGGCGTGGMGPPPAAVVAPSGTSTILARCWVQYNGSASALTLTQLSGPNGDSGYAFDGGYDGSTNNVILAGDGHRGIVKSATTSSGVPTFPINADAAAGTGASSGGIAVNGFNVAVVSSTAYGPSGTSQVATELSESGGALSLASDDGGATMTTVVKAGGNTTDWWHGASGSWLVYGTSGQNNDTLTGVKNWTHATAPLNQPNLSGTDVTSLGLAQTGSAPAVNAVKGVPGADTMFAGTGGSRIAPGNDTANGAIARVDLGNGPSATVAKTVTVTAPVTSLVYCPADSGNAGAADTLYVGTSNRMGDTGGLYKIANASTASTLTATALTAAPTNEGVLALAVDCASGTIYDGTFVVPNTPTDPTGSVRVSTDNGATFHDITPGGSGAASVTAMVLDPHDAGSLMVAYGSKGFVQGTTDFGANWFMLNDPDNGGRNFSADGPAITSMTMPPNAVAPSAVVRPRTGGDRFHSAAVTDNDLLFGTGAGLFSAPVNQSGQLTSFNGYRLAGSDGGVFAFGDSGFFGSAGGSHLNKPIVGMASTNDDQGYWLVAADGGVFAYGDAQFFGSAGGLALNKPIVGMVPTWDSGGYWLVASDGGVFAYGDAQFYGSAGALPLNQPVVGIVNTSGDGGYWLVAADGGVFAYGDAGFYGSAGGTHLNTPIVGITSLDDGGYALVASDGGVFAYGDMLFFGSAGGEHLAAPVVGIVPSWSGDGGYWLIAADGGVFSYGDSSFAGSAASLNLKGRIVGGSY
jgi:hypothetical protein